jgi:hypothetical protein
MDDMHIKYLRCVEGLSTNNKKILAALAVVQSPPHFWCESFPHPLVAALLAYLRFG